MIDVDNWVRDNFVRNSKKSLNYIAQQQLFHSGQISNTSAASPGLRAADTISISFRKSSLAFSFSSSCSLSFLKKPDEKKRLG